MQMLRLMRVWQLEWHEPHSFFNTDPLLGGAFQMGVWTPMFCPPPCGSAQLFSSLTPVSICRLIQPGVSWRNHLLLYLRSSQKQINQWLQWILIKLKDTLVRDRLPILLPLHLVPFRSTVMRVVPIFFLFISQQKHNLKFIVKGWAVPSTLPFSAWMQI